MVSRGFLWGIIIAVVIIVAALLIWGFRGPENPAGNSILTGNDSGDGGVLGANEQIVQITETGFSPQRVEVPKGGTVTFVNMRQNESWPASAVHPTHKAYPGSGIEKCGTAEENQIFDACRGIPTGESYSFTFNEVGEWNYHDHLDPTKVGTVVVRGD